MEALIKSLLLFIALFALCQGNAIQGTSSNAEENVLIGLRRVPNRYDLYTGASNNAEDLTVANIAETNFDPAAKTVIIIHDKSESARNNFIQQLRIDLMNHEAGPYNVICMDWSVVANLNSDFILENSEFVAQELTELIEAILEQPDTDPGTIHIIGFGIGAHLAGMASRNVEDQIGRITGLDPASDGGRWTHSRHRLTASDAFYVDVIHTDGSGNNANGILEPLGDVDFYPNGGTNRQPGCTNNACSHARAAQLFAASLDYQLTGFFCQTLALMSSNRCDINISLKMGGLAPSSFYLSGIYRMPTGRVSPFTV